jgi:dTDP-4-dehydrorhamnose reductase
MFLIVGGDSEIGAATFHAIKEEGKSVLATTRRPDRVASDRPLLDLFNPLDFWEPPQATRAACVCAAVARLASCATDPEGTTQINVTRTVDLIDKLLARDIYVLFLSTNQVFDGRAPQMSADAPPAPVSEYGRQKARTEAALRQRMERGAPVAILRLSKVVSPVMPLIHDWIAALKSGRSVRAFNDMTLAPVPVVIASAAIRALMGDRARGVFQITGPMDVTYAEVARFIANRVGADPRLVRETSAYTAGLPEGMTPHHTTLDSSLLRERYGFDVPDAWNVFKGIVAAAEEAGCRSATPVKLL